MKNFTIDASVVIKWIFPERPHEDHLPQAVNLLQAIKQDAVKVYQPVHWLAETIAVVVRLQPKITDEITGLLNTMALLIIDEPEVYSLACRLAERFDHHLFDTLYHAVALYRGDTQLITADDKYYRKAFKQGAIIKLANFSIFDA